MLNRFESMAKEAGPAMNAVGKLSVQALDTLPLPLLVILFLVCLFLLNAPLASSSLLPTHSPIPSEKDRLSPLPPPTPSHYASPAGSPQFDLGVFSNSPQYVAVVSNGRRSSRFRDWRSTSLESVQEVDEKREEEV